MGGEREGAVRRKSSPRAFAALDEQLSGRAPRGLRALDDEHLRDLTGALMQAQRREAQAIAEAGERALAHIPRLLRGPIRRIVG